MLIKKCSGYELEKEKRNTSEDSFNRSKVTFMIQNEERTLHVLYLRYFDEIFAEISPFKEDPLISIGEKSYEFKDVVALVCLLNNDAFRTRKRVYINDVDEFKSYFENLNIEQLFNILRKIVEDGSFKVDSVVKVVN